MPSVSPISEWPTVSIVIPAFNEEFIIKERIRNINESSYPKNCLEIIVIDDASTDRTTDFAKEAIKEFFIPGCIISNHERMGTNRSFNRGISRSGGDIIVTTGADVFFERDALCNVISRLLSDQEIGAVCADMKPLISRDSHETVNRERAYRNYYGLMCSWESAHDSTFNFNGGLVAFRKGAVAKIREQRGADDANTAFEVIRNGKRAVYEIDALVYEEIMEDRASQSRQKIRRAKRLIEATLANLDLLSQKRPFSRIFYPLRIFMNVCSPVLFFLGTSISILGIIPYSLFGAAAVFIGLIVILAGRSIASVFLWNQYFLFRGLLNIGRDTLVWESTSRKN